MDETGVTPVAEAARWRVEQFPALRARCTIGGDDGSVVDHYGTKNNIRARAAADIGDAELDAAILTLPG